MIIKKPIILVDCDGVLADLDLLINSLNKVLKTDINIMKCDRYHLHEIWQTTPEVMAKALDKIDDFFSYEDIEPVEYSKESVRSLQKYFEFKVLTARRPKHQEQTRSWVGKHFGKDIEIIYARANANIHGNNASKTKIDFCRELGAFALIEDNPYELEELARHAPEVLPICHKLKFNEHLKNNPKIFVGSWQEISKFLIKQHKQMAGS